MSASMRVVEDVPEKDTKLCEEIPSEFDSDIPFTDGCGYICEEFLLKASNQLDMTKTSAIQMRFAGFKGVLVCHKGLGKNGNPKILFRMGMKKFEGALRELSAIRCSTYSPAFLNRQVILILSHLGVPDEVFLKRNEIAMFKLDIRKTLDRLVKQMM